MRFAINRNGSRQVTIQAVWIKFAQSVTPIQVQMSGNTYKMRKGDTIDISVEADEIIEALGSDDPILIMQYPTIARDGSLIDPKFDEGDEVDGASYGVKPDPENPETGYTYHDGPL